MAAFTRAAETVAHAGSLHDTLDRICGEIVRSADLAAAQILLIDESNLRLQVHGAAPVEVFPADFALRLDEARRSGAELKSLVAIDTRSPVVALHRKAVMLANPRWRPLHAHLQCFEWDSFVSVPLFVHDRPIGALNAYFPPGRQPVREEVGFVASMADQAATAVHNARLIAESKGRAALDERYRLARDLHDSACQELFSLTLELRAAKRALEAGRGGDAASVRQRVEAMERLAYSALGELRALVFELHPTLLHADGIGVALRREADAMAARENLDVHVNVPSERLAISTEAELELYRLGKEAMHNAVKHADARTVTVTLTEDPPGSARLVLTVSDDGHGFDLDSPTAGLGLVSMRERAERIGGKLTVESRPSSGTTVRASVPGLLTPAAAATRGAG